MNEFTNVLQDAARFLVRAVFSWSMLMVIGAATLFYFIMESSSNTRNINEFCLSNGMIMVQVPNADARCVEPKNLVAIREYTDGATPPPPPATPAAPQSKK